ncbi:MAG: holo-ACP synthase [Spirochaeta sp.]
MILGTGIDLVRTERLRDWLHNGLAERFFHPAEVAACRNRGNRGSEALASRFAAKEAFGKALGTGVMGLKLSEIEVSADETGRPLLRLHGDVLQKAESRAVHRIHLSLTHDGEYAAAMVVLEGMSNE